LKFYKQQGGDMLNEKSREALLAAVMETLETMAFFEVTENDKFEQSYIEDSAVWSEIVIHGQKGNLRMVLSIPEVFAREITAQVYADSVPVISNELLLDSVAELNNTISGSFMLSEGVNTKDHYTLSLPQTVLKTGSDCGETNLKLQCLLDGRMVISIMCCAQ